MLEEIATFNAGRKACASGTNDNLTEVNVDWGLAAIIVDFVNAGNLVNSTQDVDDVAVLVIWPGDVGNDNRVFCCLSKSAGWAK